MRCFFTDITLIPAFPLGGKVTFLAFSILLLPDRTLHVQLTCIAVAAGCHPALEADLTKGGVANFLTYLNTGSNQEMIPDTLSPISAPRLFSEHSFIKLCDTKIGHSKMEPLRFRRGSIITSNY